MIKTHGSRHTAQFLKRTSAILGASESDVKRLLQNAPYKAFRINRLKVSDAQTIEQEFADIGVPIRPLSWYPDAYIFESEDTSKVQSSDAAESGHIFIQNPSSYLPVFALEPTKDDHILDMCSAPGGKAAMIASLVGNADKLTVNEPKSLRVDKLNDVLQLQGANGAEVTNYDGRHLPTEIDKQFNKVLIDAECSTEGGVNFLSKDPLKGWSENLITEVSVLQKQLITAGYDVLEPGGVLVYSTCTFAPEENEAVIESLLERRPDAVLQPLRFSNEKQIRHIHSWNGQKFQNKIATGVLRIYPSDYMEGFFVARVRKPYHADQDNLTINQPLSLDDVCRRYAQIDMTS